MIINSYAFGSAPTVPYETLVTAAAPVMWWKLNEVSGTTAVDSGSAGKNGTLTGGANFSTVGVAAAPGLAGVGRGADLAVASASDIRASALSGASLNALGGGGSASSWTIVIVCASGSQDYLASRSNDFAVLHGYVPGQVEFFAIGYTGSDPRTGSQMALPSGDTGVHQIAYRYDNGNWSGILDGVEVFNVTRSFGLVASNTNFYLGSDSSSGSTAESNRKFYDLQTYNRAVSTADLAAMWGSRNVV